MKLYTSYFAKVKELKELGYNNIVCVAGYAPMFYYNTDGARFMPSLAPKSGWFWEWKNGHLPNEWYIQKYNETVLSKLDPNKVVEELGENAVMLCYEKPGDFCHRHLIAEWLMKNTGVTVEEVQFPAKN